MASLEEKSLVLTNTLGQRVSAVAFPDNVTEHGFNLDNLNKGLYFYQIVQGNRVLNTGKLVVE